MLQLFFATQASCGVHIVMSTFLIFLFKSFFTLIYCGFYIEYFNLTFVVD